MATDVLAGYDLEALNRKFQHSHALDIIAWAVEEFGESLAVSSSFGAESAVMLHLATRLDPDVKIITIDTGFLFPETIKFREELTRRLNLNLIIYRPVISREDFLKHYGKMWRFDADACCALNKREPFIRAMRELHIRCWMAGIRKEQAITRENASIVELDSLGLIKVCPIVFWTAKDVRNYLKDNDLPYNPLWAKGYLSIGCRPEEGYCTAKVRPGADPRSGRWVGFEKKECGLHDYGRDDDT